MNIHLAQATEFFQRFFRFGGNIKMVVKLLADDALMERLVKNLAQEPVFRLIHGRFNTLQDKIDMVKSWPGVDPKDVDAAVAMAHENGLIAGYEAESPKHALLDIVITVNKESVSATLLYVRDRIKDAFGENYSEWTDAYASGVDEDRIKMIPGAEFTPNCIKVEVVDLKANHNPKGVILGDVQKAQAGQLAGFAVLYAACQSPEWVRQIDGEKVPWAIAAALLLNVPGYDLWSYSPYVYRNGEGVRLFGDHVDGKCLSTSFPVLRKYKS